MNQNNKGFTLIEVLVFLALLVVAGVFLFNLTGCTDDDQAKEVARQRAIETREAAEQQANQQNSGQSADTSTQQTEVAQNDTPAEPEKPAEPQTETITTYHFTSTTERSSVDCANEGKVEACGVNYASCGKDGADSYACQTGVHEWATSREELVK